MYWTKTAAAEKQRFDINNGLPHNSINKILVARDGNVYIGTESDRLFSIDKNFNIIQGNGIMYGSTINKILSFAQSRMEQSGPQPKATGSSDS